MLIWVVGFAGGGTMGLSSELHEVIMQALFSASIANSIQTAICFIFVIDVILFPWIRLQATLYLPEYIHASPFSMNIIGANIVMII